MCFLKEKHSTSKSSQVHKNTFCSSFVHQLTTHVTYYTYWDLSTNSCRGFFCWVFLRESCPVGPHFTLFFYYFFMKTCDVRQCIKNLNGFSFSASILCNVIKMGQLIWSFWFNIQFKTYRRVLRGWPMVFWDKFKHSQPRCRRTLLFFLFLACTHAPDLYLKICLLWARQCSPSTSISRNNPCRRAMQ